jgi:ferredoxin-type protein NapG
LHRPPGAVPEAQFLAGCTRCGDCAEACPHAAIQSGAARLGEARGTPVIDAAAAPCRSCVDRDCAVACEPGVLRVDGPGRMATVRLQPHLCLGALGVGCSSCVEQCPVPGAIRLDGNRPVIDAGTCTGCGVCLHVCPAPQKALLLLPLARRDEVTA